MPGAMDTALKRDINLNDYVSRTQLLLPQNQLPFRISKNRQSVLNDNPFIFLSIVLNK